MSDLIALARRHKHIAPTHYEGCEADHIGCLVNKLADDIEGLRAEIERLREALRWYADPRNHFHVERRNPGDPDPAVIFVEEPQIMDDCGRRARAALEGKP